MSKRPCSPGGGGTSKKQTHSTDSNDNISKRLFDDMQLRLQQLYHNTHLVSLANSRLVCDHQKMLLQNQQQRDEIINLKNCYRELERSVNVFRDAANEQKRLKEEALEEIRTLKTAAGCSTDMETYTVKW